MKQPLNAWFFFEYFTLCIRSNNLFFYLICICGHVTEFKIAAILENQDGSHQLQNGDKAFIGETVLDQDF